MREWGKIKDEREWENTPTYSKISAVNSTDCCARNVHISFPNFKILSQNRVYKDRLLIFIACVKLH